VYAVRYDNARTGKGGWIPAVRGGWRKGVRHEDRNYLPLTAAVLAAHLKGEAHIGLYPLLDGDRCWWLAADFDGPEAMFDALMYVKAGRALQIPVALEVSRSGVGAHAWVFFTAPVPAELARRLGTGLLREAMALRGRMTLASYDRLFPSQDLLPVGGIGNLIAAPLFKPARDNGALRERASSALERRRRVPPRFRCSAGPARGDHWNRYASGHHVIALLHLVADLRRIPVGAGYRDEIDTRAPLGIDSGVGPVRHPVRAHAPGIYPQGGHRLLHQCLRTVAGLLALSERVFGERPAGPAAVRVQVLAGCLGRLELGAADPELLRAGLRHTSAAGRVGEVRHPVRAHALGVSDR
jgi:hypothetical protein